MKQTAINDPYIILRKDQVKKDSSQALIMRIIFNGKKKDLSLGVSCPEGFFDHTKGKIKRAYPNSDQLNLLIEKQLNKARSIVLNARIKDLKLTVEEFMLQYHGSNNSENFIDFVRKEIELEKKKENKAKGTVAKYGFQLGKLIKFKEEIKFRDLTESFLANYEVYMRDVLKNQKSSSNNSLKFIRKFLNVAISKGITDNYPFKNYHLKEDKTLKIKYLSETEFKALKEYFNQLDPKHKHYRTVKSFIFSCYTGLRYGDVKQLTLNDTKHDVIKITMQKTKQQVSVPLLSEAKKLLNYTLAGNLPNLNTPSDQHYNRQLKDIAKQLEIRRDLTTHVARHTCATMMINNGTPLEIVQSVLGHSDIKQTQHYAKLLDKTKQIHFDRLEGKF